jgi:hypothetical protein
MTAPNVVGPLDEHGRETQARGGLHVVVGARRDVPPIAPEGIPRLDDTAVQNSGAGL